MKSRNKHYPVNAICLLFSCCLAFVYVLPLIGVAHAQTIHEARAAYVQGRFMEAARIGESLKTSQGFALSAKSLSIHAHYLAKKDENKELLERALRLAKKQFSPIPVMRMPICNWRALSDGGLRLSAFSKRRARRKKYANPRKTRLELTPNW